MRELVVNKAKRKLYEKREKDRRMMMMRGGGKKKLRENCCVCLVYPIFCRDTPLKRLADLSFPFPSPVCVYGSKNPFSEEETAVQDFHKFIPRVLCECLILGLFQFFTETFVLLVLGRRALEKHTHITNTICSCSCRVGFIPPLVTAPPTCVG